MLHNIPEEHRSHGNLVMQALVSFCMDWLRVIWFGAIQFGGSYMNLRRLHILKGQILGKAISCIWVKTVILKLWRLHVSWYNCDKQKWIETGDRKRITNANRTYYALLPALKSQSVLRAERMKVYKILIRLVATYRAEYWTLDKGIAKWLAAFLKEKF